MARLEGIVSIIFNGLILSYLNALQNEKCSCALTSMHSILTFTIGLSLIANVFQLITGKYITDIFAHYQIIQIIFIILGLIFSIIYYVVAILYIQNLYSGFCPCSASFIRTLFKWTVYFQVISVSIVYIIGLFTPK